MNIITNQNLSIDFYSKIEYIILQIPFQLSLFTHSDRIIHEQKGGLYMALIKCPECGQQVSNKADACIHCGAPLKASHPEPVYISFPHVSTFVGKGTVYYNGTSESCPPGGTICIEIGAPTTIEVKMNGYFGRPSIQVKPGDKIQVILTVLGKVTLSKVSTLSTNVSSYW